MNIPNLVGLAGVILILIAYFLLVMDKIDSHTYLYTILNLVGSLMIMYSLLYAWNLSAFVMELAWAAVSLYGICKVIKKKF